MFFVDKGPVNARLTLVCLPFQDMPALILPWHVLYCWKTGTLY